MPVNADEKIREITFARTRGTHARLRQCFALLLTLACVAGFAATHFFDASSAVSPFKLAGAALTLESMKTSPTSSQFSHETPTHRGVACAACHQRVDNSAEPRVPGHKACTDCHLQQFVGQPDLPMCSICHTNLETRNPPVKAFPRLRSFNVKFDHAQHTTGAGSSEKGCAACHSPSGRGVALTIPSGLDAHARCYTCHTPQATAAGRDIANCGACHDLSPYAPTPTGSKAFRIGFSHATHGARQRLDCASCHTVRAGLPQSRQVASPTPAQHFPPRRAQSCATCHNNRRAFGGEDFSDCKRCHTGTTFRF